MANSDPTAADDLEALLASWQRHLRASKVAVQTLRTYTQSVNAFLRYLRSLEDPPLDLDDITRDHIQDWLADLEQNDASDWTLVTRFTNMRTFFIWLANEEEIAADPTKGMRTPKIGTKPVPVLQPEIIKALLATCDNSFDGRRDEALFRVYADSGLRLNECTKLLLSQVDMEQQILWVDGKGGKVRAAPFAAKTARALDRYLRARRKHPYAKHSEQLWLGRKGPLTGEGVRHMLRRRGEAAGVGHVRPHQFRHTAAHQLRKAGMNDQDMKRIFGWTSDKMLERYGESAADERAQESLRRLSFGDQL